MNLRDTLYIKENHLYIGQIDTVKLAKEFGTPLYVLDEDYIRKMCQTYNSALKPYGHYRILYASKAFSCTGIYKIMTSENVGADVASGGELYTALSSGMSSDLIYFHGNNKTEKELSEAVDAKVNCIVIDSFDEIDVLNEICQNKKKIANVLIRVNPKVEAHTHHYIQTARADSKFGFSIEDAWLAVEKIIRKSNLKFLGLHCHIGSQIFEIKPYQITIGIMTDFMQKIKADFNIDTEELDIGGGFGVYYADDEKKFQPKDYVFYINSIIYELEKNLADKNLKKPCLIIEPGRSLVAEAGITLYTAGNIKELKNIRKYVSVDGGMFDNPRFALYQAKYSAVIANRAADKNEEVITVCGKCCESGDMLIVDINFPKVRRGDIIAVFTTGAYNYSMASNYNRNAVPPVVLVNGKNVEYLVKPQSYEDIVRNDNVPRWLK